MHPLNEVLQGCFIEFLEAGVAEVFGDDLEVGGEFLEAGITDVIEFEVAFELPNPGLIGFTDLVSYRSY